LSLVLGFEIIATTEVVVDYFLANAGFFAANEYQHLSNGIVDNCF